MRQAINWQPPPSYTLRGMAETIAHFERAQASRARDASAPWLKRRASSTPGRANVAPTRPESGP
jgi:hypothetical protein